MTIRIVTDSTCDLPEHVVSQHKIIIIPLHINQGDQTFLDGVDMTREEFYRRLPGIRTTEGTKPAIGSTRSDLPSR